MSRQRWARRELVPLEGTGGWRSAAPAVALGFLAAVAAQVALVAVLISVALAVQDPAGTPDTGDQVRVSVVAAAVLGLSCALGAWLCGRRLRVRRLPVRRVRAVATLTAAAFAALALGLGVTPALTPLTLPVQLAGAALGILLGARRGSGRAAAA